MNRGSILSAFAALALFLPASAPAATACEIPSEPVHWIADYCMLVLQTDDEIAAGDCIARELAGRQGDACMVKQRYKRLMCEIAVSRDRKGTVAACLKDPAFQGSTVRNGGVGR